MKAFKAFLKPFEAPQRTNQLTGFYMRATHALNGLTGISEASEAFLSPSKATFLRVSSKVTK